MNSLDGRKLDELLDRPAAQRLMEHRYRFSQAMVFGLPVLALQWWGARLGGRGGENWVALLQVLLTGWVVYVGATGMLVDGALRLRRRGRFSADFLVALLVAAMYAASLASFVHIFFAGRLWFTPTLFHCCVLSLALWTGLRWLSLHYLLQSRPCSGTSPSASSSSR